MARQPTEGSSASTRAKGSVRPSCETCRLRRVKCVRPDDAGQEHACEACTKKGISCVFLDRPKTRNRTGKNVEAARNRYGSILPAPSNSASPARRTPSPQLALQTSLVREELARAFGDKLFELWLDQTQLRENWPPLDLPVVDFWALRSRYRDAGRSLELLSSGEQLLCRLVYAVAAPMYLPNHLSNNSRHDIATKLFQDAEQGADSLAIWRKTDETHVASLVMFHKALATRDMNHDEAPAYLAAAVQQLRSLSRRGGQDTFADGNAEASRLSWCTAVVDVLSAAERKTKPCLTRDELSEYLGRKEPSLPDLTLLREMLQVSAEITTGQVLDALCVLVFLAFDIATHVATSSGTGDEISKFWLQLDHIYSWCHGSLTLCSISVGDGSGICRVYSGAIWAISVMLEFTLVEHLTNLVTRLVAESSSSFEKLDADKLTSSVGLRNLAQARTLRSVCNCLNISRQLSQVWTFGIIHRVGCSVQRVLDFAHAFSSAPDNDYDLFPQGATDKCASLEYLIPQISRLQEAYPSPRMTSVLEGLRKELSWMKTPREESDHSVFELLPTPSNGSSTETLPFFSPELGATCDASPINLDAGGNTGEASWDWQELINGDMLSASALEQFSNSLHSQ